MTMTAFVSIDGSSKGSGSLAAFAGSQIRGLQSNLSFPPFGPHQGQGLFQIMIYGEIDSTPLQFKWSTDGTEANAISVSRQDGISISFENNGNQGSVMSPVSLLGTSQPDNSYQSDSGNYQSSGGDYQSDSDGYQSPDSDYQDPAGVQAEENTPFTVTVFVTTIGFQSNVNEVTLSGEILHKSESDYTNIKVGFLISPSAEIMESDPLTYKVSGFFESADLFSANYTPSSNGVLYFKAFAENESGVSYGNIRKISNNVISNTQNQTPTEKAISTLEKDSIELPGGWRDNSWFGLYKAYENGWIYHSAHGWLYLSADSSDGIWAWSEKRSWVWSSKEIYPFLYQPSIGNWIYFLTSKNGQVYFFNYSTNLVEVNIP